MPSTFRALHAGARALVLGACTVLSLGMASPSRAQSDAGTFTTPGYPQVDPRSSADPAASAAQARRGYDSTGMLRNRNPPGEVNAQDRRNERDSRDVRRFDPVPAKPSEFQKFVEAATGRLLPNFGTGFFAATQEGFAPSDNVPVSADYTVGPGDEVMVRAWGSIDVDYRSTVDRNGLLNLPKIGSFNVAGVRAADLESHLRAQIGRLYTNFNLNVTLGQLRSVKVFVVGPATRPGVYTLSSQSTLLSAVVAAGGPAPAGSMRKISLRRDGRIVSELDVYEFLVQGDKSRDVQLAAGDVVVFQAAGPRIGLTGALDNAAIYELKAAEEPLREVLRYAGGAPVLATPHQAQLERIDPSQSRASRFVEQFKLDANGVQQLLHDGDIVTLLPISPQFANAVTLKGHVAQPLRYRYTPGMRIRDLIPDREALITPDFYRRKNLLVQVIEDDEAPSRDATNGINGSGFNNGSNNNGNFSGGDLSGTSASRIDLSTSTYGSDGASRNTGGNGNARNDAMRGTSSSRERERDRDLVARTRTAPVPLFDDLNWEYAVIERLNPQDLTTNVIPFNLGAVVLRGDEANNLTLQPGDVVTIYSQKDLRGPVSRQTRLVSVEGEVGAPGVYQLQPGETLRALLQRAGGFTPQAYVYGLEFSREETRTKQRENLAAAIARLEALSSVQTARDAANRRDDPSGPQSAAVSAAATRVQTARLQQLQPNGRIALELRPQDNSVDALPELPLEQGDRIVVPTRPGFVTVAGAVVNSNAFLWKAGRTAGDYMRLAGLDESAEPANMFILRADGTVSHAGDSRGFFGRNSLESQPMQPGDALIVPTQLDFESFGRALVRNLKDFSQIFSQFGLGIAAIHTLNN